MPGGRLPLRIFEQRYLDMVKDCLKTKSGFGICLISKGEEVRPPTEVFPHGTLVDIVDWDTDASGLLLIVTKGVQKFRIIDTTLRTTGLLVGEVELLPIAQKTPIPAQYSDLAELLQRTMPSDKMLADDITETDFEDSTWVINRLVEGLPMSLEARYKLMVMDDAIEQLNALQKIIRNL